MQPEYFCDGSKWFEAESRTDARLWTTSDEELDVRDLVHAAGEYREDCRGRFFVLSLIEGIDDNESRNLAGFEWTNNESLYL